MDVPSDRVTCIHVSRLRHVKEIRERGARTELSSMEAKCRFETLAAERAARALAVAEERRVKAQAEIYQQLTSSGTVSVVELDRCELIVERLALEVTSKRQAFEDARVAQEQAETAASERRTHWAKCSAATDKWRQIETDVRRAADTHAEVRAEIEADDEVLFRTGFAPRAADGSI
ncbi:YscO family type III secretion system apparatus protein [Bradyrhizobium diazoefficiens]|nr:YscO family type III secretion system apparatus protein [Bradyrhizobium diazoefficiens]MBK3666662.1 YscO family type III secretion system apparatus protein [Bradyrhizobium diazoefficiens]